MLRYATPLFRWLRAVVCQRCRRYAMLPYCFAAVFTLIRMPLCRFVDTRYAMSFDTLRHDEVVYATP